MRSVVAGIGLVSVIGAMILGSYVVVKAMGAERSGGWGRGELARAPHLGDSGNELQRHLHDGRGLAERQRRPGDCPGDYELSGDGVTGVNVVTATIRQQGSAGALQAEILEDGRVVQAQQTDAANTHLNLTYSP